MMTIDEFDAALKKRQTGWISDRSGDLPGKGLTMCLPIFRLK